jgi:flagellar motor switch/type III secretory pathway protein FliN
MSFRPFPWASLDSTTRAEAAALHDLRRWTTAHIQWEALAAAMGSIVGATVEVRLGRAQAVPTLRAFGEGFGVVLASADAPPQEPGALVEAEGALVTAIAARALKRPPPVLVDAGGTHSPALAGAFAAILVAAARRAHSSLSLRVVYAGPAAQLEMDLARGARDLVAVSLTVLVDDDAYAARVVLSRRLVATAPLVRWTRAELSGLGATPLSLPVVATVSSAMAADIASLRPGDGFLPGRWSLSRVANKDGWLGRVILAPPDADTGISAELVEGHGLVLRGGIEPLAAEEAEMADSEGSEALITAVGEVPVLVRVEIGEARMTARDWASLGQGDVIALGRRIGERVVLRVGGVTVARGELVEIDGEVGVRIVERVNV